MSRWVLVLNQSRGGARVLRARWCSSFVCRLRGLTWRRSLPEGEGLLLVESGEGRARTAIHMWMMFLTLGVAWIDSHGKVVDCRRAAPWRVYVPRAAARYTLEGPVSMLESLAIGDQVLIIDETPT